MYFSTGWQPFVLFFQPLRLLFSVGLQAGSAAVEQPSEEPAALREVPLQGGGEICKVRLQDSAKIRDSKVLCRAVCLFSQNFEFLCPHFRCAVHGRTTKGGGGSSSLARRRDSSPCSIFCPELDQRSMIIIITFILSLSCFHCY